MQKSFRVFYDKVKKGTINNFSYFFFHFDIQCKFSIYELFN